MEIVLATQNKDKIKEINKTIEEKECRARKEAKLAEEKAVKLAKKRIRKIYQSSNDIG
jgi:inosine/xanthosine triphosphate pyrophosphatase family protein